ncbi:MAG: type II toxin-antitoxin system HicB family antitoxin [Spirochaetaceae bacterium]|nr:type II toxin-antitoxin system HicB family antitoxin [Spirochaetaceae bacterium]
MTSRDLVDKYTYRVEWSEEDNTHVAHCLEFPSLMAHGATAGVALNEIENVVQESIKWMEEDNEVIPEPLGLKHFNGNLTLRIPRAVHRELAIRSAEEGVSMNKYILARI